MSTTATGISAIRSIELAVPDLDRAASFYTDSWGLEVVEANNCTTYLRATGSEHHVVRLREQSKTGVLAVHLAANDRADVDRVYHRAIASGVDVLGGPEQLPRVAGGGYGFSFRSPDFQLFTVSTGVAQHPTSQLDSSRPLNLTHVVLNSPAVRTQVAFFIDVFGFRLSDATDRMEFIRCGRDHHTLAFARGGSPSLNHAAFKMVDIDGLMRGAGRMKRHGFEMEWGLGRHGPGDNVFAYFVDPQGFAVEYTTDIQQIDDATYVPHSAEYWAKFPLRPCRWGMATRPSDRLKLAMAGSALLDAVMT